MTITFGSTRPVMLGSQAKAQALGVHFGSETVTCRYANGGVTLNGVFYPTSESWDQESFRLNTNESLLISELQRKTLVACLYYDQDKWSDSKLCFEFSDGTKFSLPPRSKDAAKRFDLPDFLKTAVRLTLEQKPTHQGELYTYKPDGENATKTILATATQAVGDEIPVAVKKQLAALLKTMGENKFIKMVKGWGES